MNNKPPAQSTKKPEIVKNADVKDNPANNVSIDDFGAFNQNMQPSAKKENKADAGGFGGFKDFAG